MKHTVGAVSLGFMILLVCGCGKSNPVAADAAVTTPPTQQAVVPQVAADTFVASGPVVVEKQVDIAALREGVVTSTAAEPGTRVRKGQILALLDNRQITADLEAARAKTRSVEADLQNWQAEAKVLDADRDRAQKMWDAGLITKEQYDHARFKAESDQWDVKRVRELLVNAQQTEHSLELELDKTRIRAPFDGIVARRYVREGQKVAIGDRLFWVTGESPLRVRFTLPEKFIGRLKRGEELAVSSPDVGETSYRAKVIEVSPVVDPSSGTIDVLAQLVGPAGDLRPGMTADVRVHISR